MLDIQNLGSAPPDLQLSSLIAPFPCASQSIYIHHMPGYAGTSSPIMLIVEHFQKCHFLAKSILRQLLYSTSSACLAHSPVSNCTGFTAKLVNRYYF